MYTILNKIKKVQHLILAIVIILPAFFLFYPKTFTTIDEHDYLYNAELLTKGELKTDCTLNIPGQWPTNLGYCISKYNIGTSFFLIPASVINKELAALTTLIVFILGIVIFYKILESYKIDTKLIYLFALFPPFIFFSRTILSEMYSMVMLLGVFYSLLNINKSFVFKLLAAFFISISIYIRYTNLIPIAIIGLYFFHIYFKEFGFYSVVRKYLVVYVIVVLSIIGILIFNNINYGGFLRSGYYFSSEQGTIVIEQIPVVFFKYLTLLNIFYPLALIVMLKSKIKHIKLLITVFASILLFYTLLKNESFPGKSSDIILGLRFLIPVYPLMLLPYLEKINSLKNKKHYRIFLYTSIVVLLIADIVLNYIHYKFILK